MAPSSQGMLALYVSAQRKDGCRYDTPSFSEVIADG